MLAFLVLMGAAVAIKFLTGSTGVAQVLMVTGLLVWLVPKIPDQIDAVRSMTGGDRPPLFPVNRSDT
jgi:hypothetical protein